MKLEALVFDDTVTIFAGKNVGGGLLRQDLRDSSFRAADGWTLIRLEKGVYSIHRDGMPKAVCVEGYGSSYVEADALEVAPVEGHSSGNQPGLAGVTLASTTSRKGKR